MAAEPTINYDDSKEVGKTVQFDTSWLNETAEASLQLFGIDINLAEGVKDNPLLILQLYKAIVLHKMEIKQDALLASLKELNEEFSNIKTELQQIKNSIDNSATTISNAINNNP